MPLNEMQKQVDEWINQYKEGYWKPLEIIARLAEENGELAREVNHRFGPKKKKSTEDLKEIEDEVGDILFTLACLSNSLKIDMNRAFGKAMDKCYGRDRDRFEKKIE
jgi:NTP pyrophosphatase (non-canonical NTP hydrolase)